MGERFNLGKLTGEQLVEFKTALKQRRGAKFLHPFVRHDKVEDRNSDIKTHDNKNHPSGHTNLVNLQETETMLAEQ